MATLIMTKLFNVSEVIKVENYTYGYNQKTTAFFGMEFNAKKGYRSTFQTINPKTGRLNAKKCSTYSYLKVTTQDENNVVKSLHFDFNGDENMNKSAEFIGANFDLFTPAEIEYFYLNFYSFLKVETKAMVIYCGANLDAVLNVLKPMVTLIVEGLKSKVNVFNDFKIDTEKLNACKVVGYSPFTTTEMVSISTLR